MEKLEKDWIKYPVLHLDLNIEKYDTPESLDKILTCHDREMLDRVSKTPILGL